MRWRSPDLNLWRQKTDGTNHFGNPVLWERNDLCLLWFPKAVSSSLSPCKIIICFLHSKKAAVPLIWKLHILISLLFWGNPLPCISTPYLGIVYLSSPFLGKISVEHLRISPILTSSIHPMILNWPLLVVFLHIWLCLALLIHLSQDIRQACLTWDLKYPPHPTTIHLHLLLNRLLAQDSFPTFTGEKLTQTMLVN